MLRQLTSFLGTLVLLGLVFGMAFWLFSRLMQPAPHEATGEKTVAPATTEVVPAAGPDNALPAQTPPQPAAAVRFSAEERREILKIHRQIADLLREKTGETP